ncbi:MAG: hypothetical protein HY681_10655 [Chloroflexi bacterium]|nr:hypothetical protein [Chloroflexota bacterium]
MAQQIYFEDIHPGDQIPPLGPQVWDTPDIVRFSSAVENYEHLHQDRKWAREHGFPDTLINGPIKNSMLSIMLTNWIGPGGFLRKLTCRHAGMDVPMNALTATGVVRGCTVGSDGLGYVDCDVQVTNQKGVATCIGSAVAVLPRRNGPGIPLSFAVPEDLLSLPSVHPAT